MSDSNASNNNGAAAAAENTNADQNAQATEQKTEEQKPKLTGEALQKALVAALEKMFARENIAGDAFLVRFSSCVLAATCCCTCTVRCMPVCWKARWVDGLQRLKCCSDHPRGD